MLEEMKNGDMLTRESFNNFMVEHSPTAMLCQEQLASITAAARVRGIK